MHRGEFIYVDADCKFLRIGKGLNSEHVIIYQDDQPFLRIEILVGAKNEYYFREEIIFWHDFVAIGLGEHAYIIHLENLDTEIIELGEYFSEFYKTNDLFLVLSGRHIYAVNEAGKSDWVARDVGIDGVVIDKIDGQYIYGQGEFDPPGGWKPFTVDLKTGKIR